MCPLVMKAMVGCWFMRYCCFAERIIRSFITLSVWRLLVIFGISVLLDPYIFRAGFGRNQCISEIVHLAGVRRSHRLHRGSSLVMCGLSYTFSWRSVF